MSTAQATPPQQPSFMSDAAPSADAMPTPSGGDAGDGACSGSESFALRVLGTSMEPEFNEGEIIIIEPAGQLRDGSYVLAMHSGEWIFRQLCRVGEGWCLHPLNPAFPDLALDDLSSIRGVIIQKSLPGRRRASKRYI